MTHDQSDPMNVDLHDLKKVVNIIMDHIIEKRGVSYLTIESDKDFYWDVSSDEIFNVKQGQPELDIGRLSDDWFFLQSTLKGPEHAVSLSLIHVAPLLRWIGEKVGQ